MKLGWWRWERARPAPETIEAEVAHQELKQVREVRRTALQNLLQKLDNIPVEEGIESIGKDLGNRR